jgi:hypothetical protein
MPFASDRSALLALPGEGAGQRCRGLLGHKPVEIVQRSVIEVERVLGTIRASYPTRRWSDALAAFLHDRDLLGQGWARESVEQMRRGELVER